MAWRLCRMRLRGYRLEGAEEVVRESIPAHDNQLY
jgi:hypothetical protein